MKYSLKGMLNASKRANRRNSQVLNKVNADNKTKKTWAKNNPLRKAAQDPVNKNRSTKTPAERMANKRQQGQALTPAHREFMNSLAPETGKRIASEQSQKNQPSYLSRLVSRKIGGSQLKNVANKIRKDKSTGNMGMYLEKKDPGLSDGYLLTKQRIHKQMMKDRVKSNKGSMGSSWNIVKR